MGDTTGLQPDTTHHPVVAYVVSRFPKISETFILNEVLEMERLGLRIELFALVKESHEVMHTEARRLTRRAHFNRVVSLATISAQWYWIRRKPRTYFSSWWHAILGNIRSPRFLVRTLVTVPHAAVFARIIERLGAERIHAHWATHPTLAAYVISKLTGLPYSFTAHAHDLFVNQSMLCEKVKEAEFVVTISEYNRRFIEQLCSAGPEKIRVIHCGVDVAEFNATADTNQDVFTIVCVASLEEKKGHPYLIDACAILRAAGLKFQCLLIGDGPDRSKIQGQITRAGLSNFVTMLGAMPKEQVIEYLRRAAVVVLPSISTASGRQEGIPVALMEAMAMERPVVATNFSGIPELVVDEECGLLVPERDSVALANAIYRLYESRELRTQLGISARTKVMEQFNLKVNAEQLHRLFVQPHQSYLRSSTVPELVSMTSKYQ